VSPEQPIYVILGLDHAPTFEPDETSWRHHWKSDLNRWLREIVGDV